MGAEIGRSGDVQKALDVLADEAFREALAPVVRWYASQEQDSIVPGNAA